MEEYAIINGLHSKTDLKLTIRKKTIQQPDIKGNTLSIPGSDKTVNLLKAISGKTNYGARKIKIEFQKADIDRSFYEIYSKAADLFHGEECQVIFSDDPGFYYTGTGKIAKGEKEGRICDFTMEITAEPYKNDITATDEPIEWDSFSFKTGIMQDCRDIQISADGTDVTVIGRKRVSAPKIFCSAPMTAIFKEEEYELADGWNKIPGIAFGDGENKIRFTGTGTVTIHYRGGCL